MDNLEGTAEFNRNHRLLNQVGLNPYQNAPIPNQQPLNIPRDELQGEYIEQDWSNELDEYSREYSPFQEIIPDTQEGWDINGDFHAVSEFTRQAITNAITPYKWAEYLQDAVTQYCSTIDYTVGRSDRCDIVQDIVSERMEALDSMEERYALEDALQIWFRTYGSNGL